MDECRNARFGAVVVLGHADYYPRFGFSSSDGQCRVSRGSGAIPFCIWCGVTGMTSAAEVDAAVDEGMVQGPPGRTAARLAALAGQWIRILTRWSVVSTGAPRCRVPRIYRFARSANVILSRLLTFVLAAHLLLFGVLQLLGIQPGEDNNRWLLYLFILAWPLLSIATFVSCLAQLKKGKAEPLLALTLATASFAGFLMWGKVYAGLW
jgi:hypothetical protein